MQLSTASRQKPGITHIISVVIVVSVPNGLS